jgi:tetratricopeptide (TPR) repeat protein
MRAGGAALPCAVVATLIARPAVAQRVSGDPEAIADAEAKERFARGSIHFNLGEFEEALAEFRAAYSLSQAPGLLFNMAQACRAARQYDLAAYYYRTYLRLVPTAPERRYVESRLSEMSAPVLRAPLPRPAPARRRAAAPADPPGPASPEPSGRGKRILGIATAGAGVVLLGTALWFGHTATDAAADVSAAFARGATYDQALAERYDEGRRAERIAVVTAAGGAALVAGGAVLWIIGLHEDRGPVRVAAIPLAGGGQLAAAWRF